MPLLKPSTPPKKTAKPAGKTIPPKKGEAPQNHPAQKGKGQSPAPTPPPPPTPALSAWDRLSPERKLDVVGIILAFFGVIIILGLASANRSAVVGGIIFFIAQIFGWGVYILPLGLLIFGLWLVFRKIERIPPLSIERVVGSVILFLWLLIVLHTFVATAETAEAEALKGIGGGYIGGKLQWFLWAGFGGGGAFIALVAWLVIGIAVLLDKPVQDLFFWLGPIFTWIRNLLNKPIASDSPAPASASTEDLTPIDPSAMPDVKPAAGIGQPTRTTSGATVIHWTLPNVSEILDAGNAPSINEDFIQQRARLIEETLASFGAPAQVVAISRGPSITQFGVEPLFLESRGGVKTKVRVSKIASLSDDLALALAAPRIRIQAPVPGHSYVGIEVPNEEMAMVALRDILEGEVYKRNTKPLNFALGRDVAGLPVIASIESMPHLLIAGTTGSGKSVCVNSILTCMLLYNTPDDLRLVLVDPKRVELTGYNGIPHLLGPVVVEMDRVIGALQWMTREMDKRYHMFAQVGSRNITDYNAKMKLKGEKKLPFLVVIIDELADLMMIAPDETEKTITRLAQLARATGIHMILATQRPSVDVVTGLIKANFPARIAFAVASNTDSRVILDQPGAERLLGRGDMLYQAPDAPSAARLQGVYVSDHEIQSLVEYWRNQAGGASPYAVAGSNPADAVPTNVPLKQAPLWEDMTKVEGDPLFDDAVEIVRKEGRASVSMLQRRLRIGYTRASRIVDTMEDKKIVGPPEGATQMRAVLDYGQTAPPKDDGM
ncbi:MAG TPA: DNA translocase FtsK 4TM domain-containing protein [Anaerolineales bacterium]|nr:DNA translocase FtsK 4TM domain-containing protein [Anaerolineales bacterium]HNC90659.1 DNA translocase FtsK 4TM domain-containing protein [Anaerolineales bacterium]HND93266.1 DNA translocase FtsK 4TM domain-containing protein [Anaerolineales bacterium]HNF36219.1 DNA translocase FtsK 4TM domain-containing protein [Anaerolineales bacterium]